MATPSDPLYIFQWHFPLIGDIQTIWDEFTGAGVNVGVYDDGIDYNHEDLAANYDASLHVVDDLGNPIDPFPSGVADGHGTACAGIIGAANNGVGGVGVAFDVTLTAVNIDFDNTGVYGSVNAVDIAPFLHVVGQAAANFDITSHSWGSTPLFFNSLNDGGFADQLDAVYGTLSSTGRGGLGTIIVQAAGNDDLDSNGDGLNASRFTITVAATEQDGTAADYTNYGAGILVAAPAAAVTTDVTGANGYDPGAYTASFNGTSAATPVVSGVIALMLQANSGLGWRDVHNILANSASHTGSAQGGPAEGFEDGAWYVNNATGWNGGGNHLHDNYGYGMVNAYNAVRMAEAWSLFGAAATSANETSVSSGLNDFTDTVVGDGNGVPFTTTFTIGTDIEIEHVALTLDFGTTYIGDVEVLLTSADGTVVQAFRTATNIGNDYSGNWTFGIDALRGELSAGTWTMEVYDHFPSTC
jgi:subtilisin family serine protease